MKLALLCTRWERVGGSERYALWLAEELSRAGHELCVLHEHGAGCELEGTRFVRLTGARALRAELTRFRPDRALVLTPTSPAYWRELARAAPVIRFVQDHTLFCPARNKLHSGGEPCTRPLGAACLGRALGEGCHGIEGRGRVGHMLGRLAATGLELVRHRAAAALVVGSRWMRAELVRLGWESERVVLLPYPAMPLERDASEGGETRRDVQPRRPPSDLPGWAGVAVDEEGVDGEAPAPPLVLAAARLALPDKGVDYLLTALALVRLPFRAVIAGDGPAREWLERKAREEGLAGRVRFTGWQDDHALAALYRRAALVAFPSVWDEPFGLVGLEAMSHARPVVAFDVGGVRDWLVPGVTGLLVPRKDVAAMARAIERLLADPRLATRLGEAGARRAREEFAPRAHVGRLVEILERARA
jgi:glycosyltransferase involved in cell wall biosynthesis